jgi:pilus assembly protein Flp/PilA
MRFMQKGDQANDVTTMNPALHFISFVQPPIKEHIMNKLTQFARALATEDEGAQVVEYALIIAVVSITLVIALRGLNGTMFTTFIARVTNCLTTSTCA